MNITFFRVIILYLAKAKTFATFAVQPGLTYIHTHVPYFLVIVSRSYTVQLKLKAVVVAKMKSKEPGKL